MLDFDGGLYVVVGFVGFVDEFEFFFDVWGFVGVDDDFLFFGVIVGVGVDNILVFLYVVGDYEVIVV